ncbi:chromosome segregation protein SMC [Clostridia bacterium]|nr:chromosome segregation protein SMC [Clostridia bacterium]
MFLKKFELHGFKSFADKTDLDFKDGISTIVGPNGSGKSNISDAILWVMGEQRMKSLRGAKVEDIIFSGSDTRKPLGMAAVSITMNNEEGVLPLPYEEVTVTRKAFRSGESEFYINKTPCRLKDIQTLFNDTGIGRDSFAMIGQGRVNEIIMAKPEDRRAMIEELAGIVKYRNRKNEALRKIANTESNLVRVMDIISELSVNLEPLSDEAQKAQTFLDIKDELDDLDINLLVRDIENGQKDKDDLSARIARMEEETAALEANIAQEEATFETERLSLDAINEELSKKQAQLYELKSTSTQLSGQLELSETMLDNLRNRKEKLEEEESWQSKKIENLNSIHQEKIEVHNKLKALLEEKSNEQHLLQNRVQFLFDKKKEKEESIDSLNGKSLDEIQYLASLRNEYNKVVYDKQATLTREDKNKEEAKKIKKQIEQLETQSNDLSNVVNQLDTEYRSLSTDLGKQKLDADTYRKKSEQMGLLLGQKQRELHEVESKKKVLEDIQKEHEGYYFGVKSVLRAKQAGEKGFNLIHGVVADLIKIDKSYLRAIETALGNSIQDLIVESQEAAKQTISYLKKSKGGRATFLPLDTIVPRTLRDKNRNVLELDGILGTANELVEHDPKIRTAIDYLLGSVLVAKDLDVAAKASRLANQSLKIVTLDGDVIHPGGSMSGGQQDNKRSSILSRNIEIQELKKSIEKIQREIGKGNIAFEKLANTIGELDSSVETISAKRREREELLFQKRQELDFLNRNLKAKKESLELYSLDGQDLSSQKQELLRSEEELEEKIRICTSRTEEFDAELSKLQNEYKQCLEQIEVAKDEQNKANIEFASLQEKESGMKDALSVYYGQTEEINGRLEQLVEEKNSLIVSMQEHEEKLVQFNENIEHLGSTIEDLTFEMQDKNKEKDALADSIKSKATGSKELRKILAEKNKILNADNVKMAKRESDLENKLKRLEERHEVSYEEALQKKRDIEDLKSAEKRLKELKREMAFLGTVNLASIDEYTRVKERYDFLSKQESDLRDSIEKLGKVISEIDGVMVERFKDSFDKIAISFKESFHSLFGGGDASLFLTDPDDLLNTGVDIEARPPGKGLKNMNLLSGGEKALTAISLLFAFLKIKPSPFCVLDEIDAALDEVNVNNFSNYLREFSGETQFVVISHRQGTIENSDSLFGVTMDKKSGITKMVSVRLAEAEEVKSEAKELQ